VRRRKRQRLRWGAVLLILAGVLLAGLAAFRPFDREARLRRLDLEGLRREARARPNDAELFLELGRRLRQSGERYQAFVMTNRAYDLSEGDPRFAAARAGAVLDSGDVDAAYRLAQEGASRWPRSGEVRAQLARVYAARGYFTDALREASTAVQLSPDHVEAWQALGNARAANKQVELAYAAFERALALEPRDAELLADYGEALAKYGRAAEAETALRRSAALAPSAARPLGVLGQLKASRARTAEERAAARALLEQARARAPEATDVEYQLALLDLRDGRDAEAIRLLRSCLGHDPAYGEAYLALGQAYQRSGQAAGARHAFAAWQRFSDYRREAAHLELRLRRRPDDVTLLRRLARLQEAYGKARLAEETRRRIRALASGGASSPEGHAGQMFKNRGNGEGER
jgi:Flp pilus assembly protein TadD